MTKRAAVMAMAGIMAVGAAGCGSSKKESKETTAAKTETAEAAETTAAGKTAQEETEEETTAKKEETEGTDPAENAKAEDLKIGIIQLIENGAFDNMREGFIAELREKGYGEDSCEIIYKCAQGDAANLNTICQGMVDEKVDLVCTIATPATQAMVNLESDIPVFFCAVSSPIGAGVISDFEKPDKNATGTSNAIPVEDIFALADELTPGVETYGILYNTSEVNSVNTAKDAKAYLDEKGISYKETAVTSSAEVQQAVQSMVGEVDAIFVPNDSSVQAAMAQVTEIARENKIPVSGSSATMVASGAFATIAVDDKEIGAMTADMAISYLEGTAVEDIPTVTVPASATVINRTTADAIGAVLSEETEKSALFLEDAE